MYERQDESSVGPNGAQAALEARVRSLEATIERLSAPVSPARAVAPVAVGSSEVAPDSGVSSLGSIRWADMGDSPKVVRSRCGFATTPAWSQAMRNADRQLQEIVFSPYVLRVSSVPDCRLPT
jgi:hypothetical protein